MVSSAAKLRIPWFIRVFLACVSFFVALDASIALNRWWLGGGFDVYLQNVMLMFVGFVVFIILFSKSKIEMIGYTFFCIAVHFIGNYEINGPSMIYLTPFDPIFGAGPAFPYGPSSIIYRKGMAIVASLLAATFLAISKLKPRQRGAFE